jgi:NAD-dependent deacetylase
MRDFDMASDNLIQQAVDMIRGSQRIVVLTGAGVSKESGVPTFRDAMDGLWARFNPQQLATPQAFAENPKRVWDWYEYRRSLVAQARPNPGHLALAELEHRAESFTVITQNVDDLHEQAGSKNIIHLHGNIAQNKCFFNCEGDPTPVDVSKLDYDREQGPPLCPYCGRWVRPDVVWFGETLPVDQLYAAKAASAAADLMLVVGTSGIVTPAATLPQIAKIKGAKIIEVNPDDSMITPIADIKLDGSSGEILPQVLKALE